MNQMIALPSEDAVELPVGTRLLNGQYRILEPLQQGGFAITYIAEDSLDRRIVIKECFPAGLCERVGGRVRAVSPRVAGHFAALRQQFLREARTMATLRHPGIVEVHQVFEENDSAYIALDFVQGIDLITVLEEQPQRLGPAFLESALRQALDALRHIHQKGVLHRDIAPDNIRVDADNNIVLIDFGAASAPGRDSLAGAEPLPAVKDGYSPHEFYRKGGLHEPASDLYSLGATFYHLITGQAPPCAEARLAAVWAGTDDPLAALAPGEWGCGHHLLATIDKALALDAAARHRSAEAWLSELDSTPRQRPETAAPFELDARIEAIVARLVRETNASLVAHVPLAARAASPAPAVAKAADMTLGKRWVDVIGAPIDDLDSWLKAQEPGSFAPAPDRPAVWPSDTPQDAPLPGDPRAGTGSDAMIAPPEPAQLSAPPRGLRSLMRGLGRFNLNRNAMAPAS